MMESSLSLAAAPSPSPSPMSSPNPASPKSALDTDDDEPSTKTAQSSSPLPRATTAEGVPTVPVIPMSKEPDVSREDEIDYDEDDEFGEEEEWCGATSTTPPPSELNLSVSTAEEEETNDAKIDVAATRDSLTSGNEKETIDENAKEETITEIATEAETLKEAPTKPSPPPPIETTNRERTDSMVDVSFTPTSSFNDSKHTPQNSPAAMDLKRAYESLEAIRVANLEIEFGGKLKNVALEHNCTQCLRIAAVSGNTQNLTQSAPPVTRRRRIGWLRRGRANSSDSSSSSGSLTSRKKPPPPCLICAYPVCPTHSCPNFSRSKITICTECSSLLSSDYVTNQLYEDAMSAATIFVDSPDHSCTFLLNNRNYIRLLDVYDRAYLILQYSTQFIPDIVVNLNENQKRSNKIGLGSSATNLVGGVTGVVGAATIFTPVGPPLLLASLLFGGGATAVTAGSDRVNYKSEARQLADRILVLFDVLGSVKEGMERVFGESQKRQSRSRATHGESSDETEEESDDYVRVDDSGNSGDEGNATEDRVLQQVDSNVTNESSSSQQKIATSAKVHEKSLTKTRAATNVSKTIPVVGSVVSVFTIAMETREMASTVKKIKAGHPCEKAEALEGIRAELEKMPKADELLKRCEEYLASVQQVADCDDDDEEDYDEGCFENYDDSGGNKIDEEENYDCGMEGKENIDEAVNVEKEKDNVEVKVKENVENVKEGDD